MTRSSININYTAALVLLAAAVFLHIKFRDNRPSKVLPCPGLMESIEVKAFHFGRFESHQALKVTHKGISRYLDCVGLKDCPTIRKKQAILLLKVDACTLSNSPHSISVYEMQLIEENKVTKIFPKPSVDR